jgi:predicted KAP-like P-loop ATPase
MWHDNEASQDLIGFERIADNISALVENTTIQPATIGLFGDWGSGKSTVLRLIEKKLEDRKETLVIKFDSWLFEGYDEVKTSLMVTIIEGISKYIRDNEALFKKVLPKLSNLLKKIDWFRIIGFVTKGSIALSSENAAAIYGPLAISDAFNLIEQPLRNGKTNKKGSAIVKDNDGETVDISISIREFRNDFSSLLEDSRITSLVVLIDDLDRCLPESIIATLEAIKLFLSVPKTVFIIAADERMVKSAISRRYYTDRTIGGDIAKEYLDKMIQIPFKLPAMNEIETETYIYLLFAENALEDKEFSMIYDTVKENRFKRNVIQPLNFGIARSCLGSSADCLEEEFAIAERIAPVLARNLNGNPRLVKRFLNSFSLRKIFAETEQLSIDYSVLAKLMILERFSTDKFTELYEWQAKQGGLPREITELEDSIYNKEQKKPKDGSTDFEIWRKDDKIIKWLKMEPSLSGVNLAPYFYLTYESLPILERTGRQLSLEQQEILTSLLSKSKAAQTAAANKLEDRTDNEKSAIYEILFERYKNNIDDKIVLNALFAVALIDHTLASKLIGLLKGLSPANIDVSTPPQLAQVSHKHGGLTTKIRELIGFWANSNNTKLAKASETILERLKP